MNISRPVLDGTRTRAIAQGVAGPVVLFLHGYTDSADTWRPVLAELDGCGLTCVAVDLPSHGEAGALGRPIALSSFDRFVATTVRHCDGGSGVIVVGNSLGGLLALRAGADAGLPIAGVLALGAPDQRLHPVLATLARTRPLLLRLLALPIPDALLGHVAAGAYTWLARVGPAGRAHASRYRRHLTRRRVRELVDVGGAVVAELHRDTSAWRPDGAGVRVPLLQVWGTRDRICPVAPERGEDHGARVLPGLGHCPQVERPHLVADLVRELVAVVETRRSRAS